MKKVLQIDIYMAHQSSDTPSLWGYKKANLDFV
jgi:hypothetical protein